MDSEDPHNVGPCNLTLRDITNTEGRRPCPPAKEQALTGINDASDRKRKRPFNQAPCIYDKDKKKVIHPPETCRHVKGKVLISNAKQYDSQSSKGDDESHGERLIIEKLSLRGVSSGQISRFASEADDSSAGPLASSSSDGEDISTESDEPKTTFGLDEQLPSCPVHVEDHKEAAFSDHKEAAFAELSHLSEKKADIGEAFTHENFQNISLCGSCPCSSCIKAAYIWSDLIYQDTRGRLSALKSSRRQTRIVEGKILRHEKAGETSQSQLKKAKSTESDLLQHWTALFHHTEDTLLCEIVQAQSSLIGIEKLKERLKRDLEALNSEPQNVSGA